MDKKQVTQPLPRTGYVTAVVTPRNEPLLMVPAEVFAKYEEDGALDGNFCAVIDNEVVASTRYRYNDFEIHSVPDFLYEKIGNGCD